MRGTITISGQMDFAEARCVAKVPDRLAVLKRAARLIMCIPSMSTPRPHADPARKRAVGMAL